MSPTPPEGPRFDLALPERVLFGPGRASEVPGLVAGFGSRALVCTGAHPARHRSLTDAVAAAGVAVSVFPVAGEPTVDVARRAVAQAREHRTDVVLGLGGGSPLDLGKAVAMLLANGGDPLDYLEVIGRGRPITERSVPYVAVPTTAGSGSEATSNAVLGSPGHRVKVSLRSPLMLARVALVDPDLTLGLPPSTTASAGMDALIQCLEPYVSRFATPVTDGFAREGLIRAARSLRAAWADGSDRSARTDMALSSLLGGLSLSNAKLGVVHGIAGPFGGMVDSPHGAVCAALLPAAIEVNLRALRERAAGHPGLERYRDVAVMITGRDAALAEDAVAWSRETNDLLSMPGLASYDIDRADLGVLVERSQRSSSMRGNPVTLTREEIAEIIERSL